MSARRDPYWRSLALTLFFFYGTSAALAWLASHWPLGFAAGLAGFFLLIYGKLAPLVRVGRRLAAGRKAPP
ncbi:MAG: hypothetical protein AB1578_16990 [Thermodesulfobacteriota bacterium]